MQRNGRFVCTDLTPLLGLKEMRAGLNCWLIVHCPTRINYVSAARSIDLLISTLHLKWPKRGKEGPRILEESRNEQRASGGRNESSGQGYRNCHLRCCKKIQPHYRGISTCSWPPTKMNRPIWKFIYSYNGMSYCRVCVVFKQKYASASFLATSSSVRRHICRAHNDSFYVRTVLDATQRPSKPADAPAKI